MRFEENHRICDCGTLADAMATAEKLYKDAIRHDCPVWALQVATLFRSICINETLGRLKAEVDDEELRRDIQTGMQGVVNMITRYQSEFGTTPSLLRQQVLEEKA